MKRMLCPINLIILFVYLSRDAFADVHEGLMRNYLTRGRVMNYLTDRIDIRVFFLKFGQEGLLKFVNQGAQRTTFYLFGGFRFHYAPISSYNLIIFS